MFGSPIFIVGAGRSGSTIFHRMLCDHPQLAWMSSLCETHPHDEMKHRLLMHCIGIPGFGRLLKRKFHPSEGYAYWNCLYRGFGRPCRDLLATDVSEVARTDIRVALPRLLIRRRHRLLVKITGWPRVGFLAEIFPDAKFVHVYRDGRAVANSMMQVDFWRGWHGPFDWRRGVLEPALQQEWEAHDRSFVALAGIEWKIMMNAMEKAKQSLPAENLLEIRYEDFAGDPLGTIRHVTDFCGLPWTGRFERTLRRYSVSTANGKWRQDLTPAQQVILQDVLHDTLARYGYS